MQIDFNDLSPSQRYFQMIQTLVPRPIAWVLSEHENGKLNLARLGANEYAALSDVIRLGRPT